METIVKLIDTLLPGGEDRTKSQKIKDALLWMILGAALAIGSLLIWADDDTDQPTPPVQIQQNQEAWLPEIIHQ